MVSHFLTAIAVSLVLGFLTGLGTGGGSLLILWLTLALGMAPAQARALNLLFFIPCALAATVLRLRQGAISFRKLLLPILAGCLGALIFSVVGRKMDTAQLKKLFGVLLIYTGLRELFYRPRNPR